MITNIPHQVKPRTTHHVIHKGKVFEAECIPGRRSGRLFYWWQNSRNQNVGVNDTEMQTLIDREEVELRVIEHNAALQAESSDYDGPDFPVSQSECDHPHKVAAPQYGDLDAEQCYDCGMYFADLCGGDDLPF